MALYDVQPTASVCLCWSTAKGSCGSCIRNEFLERTTQFLVCCLLFFSFPNSQIYFQGFGVMEYDECQGPIISNSLSERRKASASVHTTLTILLGLYKYKSYRIVAMLLVHVFFKFMMLIIYYFQLKTLKPYSLKLIKNR